MIFLAEKMKKINFLSVKGGTGLNFIFPPFYLDIFSQILRANHIAGSWKPITSWILTATHRAGSWGPIRKLDSKSLSQWEHRRRPSWMSSHGAWELLEDQCLASTTRVNTWQFCSWLKNSDTHWIVQETTSFGNKAIVVIICVKNLLVLRC